MQLEVSFTGGLCVDGMMQLDSFLVCNREGYPVILVTARNQEYSCLGTGSMMCMALAAGVVCRADLEAWHLGKAAQLLPGSVLQPVGGRIGDGASIT